jgi:hypothetical protein
MVGLNNKNLASIWGVWYGDNLRRGASPNQKSGVAAERERQHPQTKESSMITPTIGRIVWYWEGDRKETDQPRAAIVVYVWTDRMVNLAVFDSNGVLYNRTSVRLVQDEGERVADSVPYAEWMPFQIGQAKRHDADTRIRANISDDIEKARADLARGAA